MLYLESFAFCDDQRAVYPYRVLAPLELGELELAPITIFYGGNGSGKSTVLNIMARAARIPSMTVGNSNEYFEGYVRRCRCGLCEEGIPEFSRFVRSEDIMDGINRIRKEHSRVKRAVSEMETDMDEEGDPKLMAGLLDPDSMTDEDRFFLSRLSSARKGFEVLFQLPDQFSNGETAMDFFDTELLADALYFLDEPENSLAPEFQQRLAHRIELLAYYLNCQVVIATHSPFLLAMQGAKIIDLDSHPACERKWYELPNVRAYYDFFKKNERAFEYRP